MTNLRDMAQMRAAVHFCSGKLADAGLSLEYLIERELSQLEMELDLGRARKEGESNAARGRIGLAQTPAPVVAASDGPAKRRNRKPSWATVALPYMKVLFAAGHYKSAAVFYKALMLRAGESDSPFKLVNRELYCTKAGTTVSNGAMGNAWAKIRAQ